MSNVLSLVGLLKVVESCASTAPNPSELQSLVGYKEVDSRRSLYCPDYDRCLETACRGGWASWTCENCRLFSLARDHRAADALHGVVARDEPPACW